MQMDHAIPRDLGTDPSLLVVEDDDAFRERLARAMARRRFDVRTASGTREGLDIVREAPPAYAIVDLRLGDGNGLDVVDEIQRVRPDARAVILTGYGDIPTAVAATRLGAVDYVAKPANADEVVDALLAPRNGHAAPRARATTPDEARNGHLLNVLEESDNNISEASRRLGMHRRTLQRILTRIGVRGAS